MRPPGSRPIVIAHRGASGYRPEHTLESYALALQMGADFIEPDLVASADGVLICRHENALAVLDAQDQPVAEATTTDVWRRAEFADRLTTKKVDGVRVRGWFSEDFTYAEIRQLHAVERLPRLRPANRAWENGTRVPSFNEVIALVQAHAARTGHTAGLYPETKHPTYFLEEGRRLDGSPVAIDLGEAVVAALVAADFVDPARVFIQSFETGNLQDLKARVMPRAGVRFPLIQLMSARHPPWDVQRAGGHLDWSEAVDFQRIAQYASGVGPDKHLLLPGGTEAELPGAKAWVGAAHAAGLDVHAWTFRAENAFLAAPLQRGTHANERGDLPREVVLFRRAGIDGFFTDHSDLVVAALAR